MHLNKLLEQIKRHQSPTEAIDKLATALEKHEGSLLEKGFTILKSELAANMYEAIGGLNGYGYGYPYGYGDSCCA